MISQRQQRGRSETRYRRSSEAVSVDYSDHLDDDVKDIVQSLNRIRQSNVSVSTNESYFSVLRSSDESVMLKERLAEMSRAATKKTSGSRFPTISTTLSLEETVTSLFSSNESLPIWSRRIRDKEPKKKSFILSAASFFNCNGGGCYEGGDHGPFREEYEEEDKPPQAVRSEEDSINDSTLSLTDHGSVSHSRESVGRMRHGNGLKASYLDMMEKKMLEETPKPKHPYNSALSIDSKPSEYTAGYSDDSVDYDSKQKAFSLGGKNKAHSQILFETVSSDSSSSSSSYSGSTRSSSLESYPQSRSYSSRSDDSPEAAEPSWSRGYDF